MGDHPADRYYEFYRKNLVLDNDRVIMPKMTPASVYPVNIHSCAESILVAATYYHEHDYARRTLDPLAEAIAALNPDMLSPREALEALYALKRLASQQENP